MKRFKKKHSRIPSVNTIRRLMERKGLLGRYERALHRSCTAFPEAIRVTSLGYINPNKRLEVCYYPDINNFALFEAPNRSLPIPKFLNLYRNYLDPAELDKLEEELNNYRVVFHTTADEWEDVYSQTSVESCMTGAAVVRCYAHPDNKLALAALYPPGGGQVIARTIVNTEAKWYVRLFGDPILVEKLRELGYGRLYDTPKQFKMYAVVHGEPANRNAQFPYFDFACVNSRVLPETFNPDTGLVEAIINEGVT